MAALLLNWPRMVEPVDVIRRFYAAINAGDIDSATSLLSAGFEWVNVEVWPESDEDDGLRTLSAFIAQTLESRYRTSWAFSMKGRGPEQVAQHVLLPFIQDGSSFAPSPVEFRAEGDKVVWLGSVTKLEGLSGARSHSEFAHVWTLNDDKLSGLRQFIYSLTVLSGRPL